VSKVRRYEVTAAGDFASVLVVLTDHLGLRLLSLDEGQRSWLDTPTGTLEQAKTTLEFRLPSGEGTPSLTWAAEGRVLVYDPCVSSTPPVQSSDLPDSAAFLRLATLVDGGELVAGPTVNSQIAVLACLDDEEKTTARIIFDRSETIDGITLPMMLEVLPLRGYEDEASELEKKLKRSVAVSTSATPIRELAQQVASAGRAAGIENDGTALVSTMSAARSWRAVLQTLNDSMVQSFSGVLSGNDPEDLHAFRVAVRRIRTILQDGDDVIDPESRDRFRHEYRWLGDVTTPTRDADVHLIEFPELVAMLPPERREELVSFNAVLSRHRADCHAAMTVELRSMRRAEFGTAWLSFLADDDAWTGCGDLADEPVLRIVLRRIEKANRQLVKNGRKISKKSPAIALHELRKEGKRLRYLLECFAPLFDEKALATILRPLRDVQDVLGEFQDTEVQANALLGLAGELASADDDSALMAIGGVIEQLGVRGADARASFAKTFGSFDDRKVQRAFDQLEPRKKKR
jgi:CHAD domain-containing protein